MNTLIQDNLIAQQDNDNDHPTGYVACVQLDRAAIGRYIHCSCYGTWTDDGPDEIWTGTVEEMVALARAKGDPAIAGRTITEEDFDYELLEAIYEKILRWAATPGRSELTPR